MKLATLYMKPVIVYETGKFVYENNKNLFMQLTNLSAVLTNLSMILTNLYVILTQMYKNNCKQDLIDLQIIKLVNHNMKNKEVGMILQEHLYKAICVEVSK